MMLPLQKTLVFVASTLVLVGIAALPAHAQAVQVPLDAEGEVAVIDADLRERLGLFPAVEGFQEARLFRGEDGGYELAIRYEEDGRMLRERRALTAAEVEALRERVSQALRQPLDRREDRTRLEDGRYRFLAATTFLGLAEGALFPVAADIEEEEIIASAPFLGAATGFFIPMLLTRNGYVTEAEATLTGYGGLQGFAHGALLSVLLAGEDPSARRAAALAGVLGAAEATAGFFFARQRSMRSGVAETMAIGGVYGTGLGIASGFLITGSGGDGDVVQRVVPLSSMAGSVLGAYGGYRLGRSASYTQGDARIFGTAGTVGTQVAAALLVVFADQLGDHTRWATGTILTGALGGLAVGHHLVREREFTEAQGSIISLGAYAGSLAGAAVSTITDASEEGTAILSAVGAAGGFAGTYLSYKGEAQAGSETLGWKVSVVPGGALPGGRGGPLGRFTPALNMRLAF